MNRIHNSYDTTFTLQSLVPFRPDLTKSIFTGHEMRVTGIPSGEPVKSTPDWVTGVLAICLMLMVWTWFFHFRRIQQVFRAPFSKRFVNQLLRDGALFDERFSYTMSLIYLLSTPLLLVQMNLLILKLPVPGLHLYFLVMAGLATFWILKILIIRLLSLVFKTGQTTLNYLQNLLIFAMISGVVSLSFLVFVIYLKSAYVLYGCLTFITFLLLFRFMRGFFIGMRLTKFSYMLLFVYLCSLEILPLLVLLKIYLKYSGRLGM